MNKILCFSLLLTAVPGHAIEFEVMDKLVVDGAATLLSSATIIVPVTQSASLWASTSTVTPHLFVSTTGNVGLGTSSPAAVLHAQSSPASAYALIVSTGSAPSQQIMSVSSSGVTNVRNLVIENRTGDPPAPSVGQVWIRTD